MDRRVAKTRKAIESAYIALRQQQSEKAITVAALCDLADVGRGTFYLHYKDIADLEQQLFQETGNELQKQFASWPPQAIGGSYHTWLAALFAAVKQQQATLKLAQGSPQAGTLTKRLQQSLQALLQKAGAITPFAACYAAGGMVAVFSAYLDQTPAMSENEVEKQLDEKLQLLFNKEPSHGTD